MNLIYSDIKNEIDTEKTAKMRLFGSVGNEINGHSFASELYYLAERSDIKAVEIHINSAGGGVVEGYSIIQAIKEVEKSKPVSTINIGVAYSIAGIIFASAEKRIILDYSTLMIHDPFLANVETVDEKQKNVLLKIKDSLSTILSNSTGQTTDFISEKMSKQTVYNAKECIKLGFADEIRKTTKKPKISNDINETIKNCLNLYSENDNKPKKTNSMIILNQLLGLSPEASETSQVEAVKNLVAQTKLVGTLSDELKRSKAEIDVLKAENSAIKEQVISEKAETLVNDAVKSGKILESSKNIWIKNAIQNFEQTQSLLNSLATVPNLNELKTPAPKQTDVIVDAEKLANEFLNMTPYALSQLTAEQIKNYETALLTANKK